MKAKRTTAAILSAVLALTVFSGCGNSGTITKGGDRAPNNNAELPAEENVPVVVNEPDFMGFLTEEGGIEFYNMSFEEFNNAAGGMFTEENAMEYDEYNGETYAKYTLGKKDSILGDRVKLAGEYEVICVLNFKKDKLKCMELRIYDMNEKDANALCADFLTAFEGKLPEKYEQFSPVDQANVYKVGFTGKVDDYAITMERKWRDIDKYNMTFELDIYAERYGMD